MSVAAKNLSSTLGLVAVLGSHSVALPRGWWQAQMIAAGYDCLPDRKGSVTMETLEDAGVELGGDEPLEQLVRRRAGGGDAVDGDRGRGRAAHGRAGDVDGQPLVRAARQRIDHERHLLVELDDAIVELAER